jgi:hypothetical protein
MKNDCLIKAYAITADNETNSRYIDVIFSVIDFEGPSGGGSIRTPIRQVFSWALLSIDDAWFVIVSSFLYLLPINWNRSKVGFSTVMGSACPILAFFFQGQIILQ